MRWQRFWHITVPHVKGVTLVTVLLLLVTNLNSFTIPYIMTGGGPAGASEIWITHIYQLAFGRIRFGARLGLLGDPVHRHDDDGLLLCACADARRREDRGMSAHAENRPDNTEPALRRKRRDPWQIGGNIFLVLLTVFSVRRWSGCSSRRSRRSSPPCSTRRNGWPEQPDDGGVLATAAPHQRCRPRLPALHGQQPLGVVRDDGARRHRRGAGGLRVLALPFPGRNLLFYSVLLRNMFPAVVFLMPLFIMMRWLGLVNTQFSLILTYLTFGLPLSIWLLKGFYDNIPVQLEQAARIDGATRFQAFILIVMPLSSPGIIATAIYSFIRPGTSMSMR